MNNFAANGRSPINCMFYNILSTFEQVGGASMSVLSGAVKKGQVSRDIQLVNDTNFRTPFACLSTRKMYLQESFLCYLWCVSYFTFFVQEELNKEQIENGQEGAFDLSKNDERTRAFRLLKWAISIRQKWSEWDVTLPNPKITESLTELEKSYIPKVNNVFCHAVAFALYHEFAHLHLQHSLSTGEYSQSQEKEADQYAREVLVDYFASDQGQLIGGMGVAVGTIAMLFINLGGLSLSSTSHPNVDLRIQFSYQHCNLIEKQDFRDYLKQLICNGSIVYFYMEKIDREPISTVENIDDAFCRILEIFDIHHGS